MLERARQIYRQSLKREDIFWNLYVSRPPAALIVWALEDREVTPNQVTFASLGVFVVAAAILAGWRSWTGLLTAAALIQASYVLDCVDGQLARYKGLASPVGALLDFLMDEVKAFLLVGAAVVRQYLASDDPVWLLLGICGLITVATGITLTSFMRRSEYLAATAGTTAPADVTTRTRRSPIARAVVAAEATGKYLFHYPSYFVFVALFDVVDLFLLVYLGTHLLYLGRSGLRVLLQLGARPSRRAPAAVAAEALADTTEREPAPPRVE